MSTVPDKNRIKSFRIQATSIIKVLSKITRLWLGETLSPTRHKNVI